MTRIDRVAAMLARSWWGMTDHRNELEDHVWDNGLPGEEIRTNGNDGRQHLRIERDGVVLTLHVPTTTPRVHLVGLLTQVAQMIADQ
jgi:hypothetical protein